MNELYKAILNHLSSELEEYPLTELFKHLESTGTLSTCIGQHERLIKLDKSAESQSWKTLMKQFSQLTNALFHFLQYVMRLSQSYTAIALNK